MIATVTGAVEEAELGVVLVHEHLRVWRGGVETEFPHLYSRAAALDDVAEHLKHVAASGVRSVCDATVMGLGRDVAFMREAAQRSGLNIIAATGSFTTVDLPPYFASRPIEILIEAFVRDIEVGIQNTPAKAGFLKCATDAAGVTADVEKCLRAVARAHRRTGVPIMTHSFSATRSGDAQQRIFDEEGVDLRAVLIGHSGDSTNFAYLEGIARRGSFLGFDRFGMSDLLGDDDRWAIVSELCERGFTKQIVLSHDFVIDYDRALLPDVVATRKNWRMTYLPGEVRTAVESSLPTTMASRVLIDNPRAWLTRRHPY